MNNLLTDIEGVRVGHVEDRDLASGTTAIIFDEPVVASMDARGGGPGTRDTTLLEPGYTVEAIHGITLSGGSAFGLDAGGGAMSWLAEHGRGFPMGNVRVPIAPGAVIFDLLNGGNKDWGNSRPIATSATRPRRRPATARSRSEASAPGSARRRRTSRAASDRHRP